MPTMKTGSDIDALCTRCRLELAHVVVAIDGSRVARVQCKTCGSVHGYRDRKAAERRKSESHPRIIGASKAGATKKSAGATASEYDSLMHGHDLSRARRYKATLSFIDGDVVDHPTFGLGLIMRLLSDGKIEVLFRDGVKVLVHAREPAPGA